MSAPLPKVSDLPIHADKLPTTTKGIVEELARIMKIDLHHDTKRDEYTMAVLSGIMLYRHLDRYERQTVLKMIQNEEHIAAIDWWEMIDRCTDVLVQPHWGLWSLTNEELESILKTQQWVSSAFGIAGVTISLSTVKDVSKTLRSNYKAKSPLLSGMKRNLAIMLIATSFWYFNETQLQNTSNELDRRSSNPIVSPYHK